MFSYSVKWQLDSPRSPESFRHLRKTSLHFCGHHNWCQRFYSRSDSTGPKVWLVERQWPFYLSSISSFVPSWLSSVADQFWILRLRGRHFHWHLHTTKILMIAWDCNSFYYLQRKWVQIGNQIRLSLYLGRLFSSFGTYLCWAFSSASVWSYKWSICRFWFAIEDSATFRWRSLCSVAFHLLFRR